MEASDETALVFTCNGHSLGGCALQLPGQTGAVKPAQTVALKAADLDVGIFIFFVGCSVGKFSFFLV